MKKGVLWQRQPIPYTLPEVTWQNSHSDLSSKIIFNDWLMTQRLDPLVLFEAVWLAKVFASLPVDASISYTFLCTQTSLYLVALLFAVLEVLCPWWDVWEVSSLDQVRKGQLGKNCWRFQAYNFWDRGHKEVEDGEIDFLPLEQFSCTLKGIYIAQFEDHCCRM